MTATECTCEDGILCASCLSITEMQRRFADRYSGDATKAAKEAGVDGTARSCSTLGSRWLRLPGVQARIAARRTRPIDDDVDADGSVDSGPTGDANLDVMRSIRDDDTAHPTARLNAARELARIARADADRASGTATVEAYQATLRAKVNELNRVRAAENRQGGTGR